MLTHLYTSQIRTGRVPVSVDVYHDHRTPPFGEGAFATASGTPGVLEIDTGLVIRYEDVKTDYGVTLRASYTEIRIKDGNGFTEAVSTLDDPDLLFRIAWPAHTTQSGASVSAGIWYGKLSEQTLKTPIARRVYPTRPLTLRVWDAIGSLAEIVATSAVAWSSVLHWLSHVKGSINRHLPLVFCADAWPGGTAGGEVRMDPRMLRFESEPSGDPDKKDYGKLGEQVDGALGPSGMILYVNTTSFDGHGPAIYCVHRQLVGRQVGIPAEHHEALRLGPGTRIPATTQPAIIPDDSVVLDPVDWLVDDELDHVSALGAIRITGDYDGNMVRPPWPNPRHMETGDVQEQVLGRVIPSSLFLQLDVQTHDTAARTQPYTQLVLAGESGTRYFLNRDGLWDTRFQFGHIEGTGIRTAVEDIPEEGILTVVAIGRGSMPSQSRYDAVAVRFVDEDGRVVTDWVVYAGSDRQGEIISLDRGPLYQRRAADNTWETAPFWDSLLVYREADGAPRRYATLGDYRAFDRMSQQAEDLMAPRGTVAGLIGPGTRIVFEGRNYIMGGGLDLDLDASQTSGGWVEQVVMPFEGVPDPDEPDWPDPQPHPGFPMELEASGGEVEIEGLAATITRTRPAGMRYIQLMAT